MKSSAKSLKNHEFSKKSMPNWAARSVSGTKTGPSPPWKHSLCLMFRKNCRFSFFRFFWFFVFFWDSSRAVLIHQRVVGQGRLGIHFSWNSNCLALWYNMGGKNSVGDESGQISMAPQNSANQKNLKNRFFGHPEEASLPPPRSSPYLIAFFFWMIFPVP